MVFGWVGGYRGAGFAACSAGFIMDDWLNANTLIASLLWGSIGVGFFVYGKKQREWIPLAAGVALIGISYFIANWLWMSLASCAVIAGTWLAVRQQA